jgi:antitoxin ParD1/3/4
MRTLTVSLTPRQADRLQEAVEAGDYASNSEVVRDALQLWEERRDLKATELARLKQAYDDGMASGEGQRVDRDTFLRDLKEERRSRG